MNFSRKHLDLPHFYHSNTEKPTFLAGNFHARQIQKGPRCADWLGDLAADVLQSLRTGTGAVGRCEWLDDG